MPVAQRDFVLKYYWAGKGDNDSPQWRGATNDKSMRRMMRASMKRARAARAMTMVMRMVSDKEGKGDGYKGGGQQRERGQQGNGNGNKSGRRALVTVRKRAMAMVMAAKLESHGGKDFTKVMAISTGIEQRR
jgi:hypothetical protein